MRGAKSVGELKRFRSRRENVSVPTGSDEVREAFAPMAPPLGRRSQALEDLKAEGVSVGLCITPMLPMESPGAFVDRARALGPGVVVTQHGDDASAGFGADTGEAARAALGRYPGGDGRTTSAASPSCARG